MIQISLSVFLALLETLLAAAALAVYWFVRARRAVSVRHKAGTAPTATAYLDGELTRTRVRLKVAASEAAAAALKLRADYLGFERECAELPGRDEAFWAKVSERLSTLVKPAKTPVAIADASQLAASKSIDIQALIESNTKEINSLKERVLHVVSDPAQGRALLEQIDRLGHVNRELADCVAVLEDENDLLLNQVQGPVSTA